MIRKGFLLVLTLLLLGAVNAQNTVLENRESKKTVTRHRVIMHISSADTLEHKGLINNLKHLKEGWGDSVEIEVVIHGPGIDLVTKGKSTQPEQLQKMIEQGINFVVYRNTMKQKMITEEKLLPGIGIVPMGIGEIILKQEQGWSYIKAGF